MSRYWFKQKRFGFGSVPVTWEGWTLTGVYVLTLVALSYWLTEGARADDPRLLTFSVLAGGATLIFLVISWRTTEGGWRWRWGKND